MAHGVVFRLLAALGIALTLALAAPGAAEASSMCRSGSPAVMFVPGGQHVLAYTPLETRVWDLEGREVFRLSGDVWRAISPDGRTIATLRTDNTVRLWALDGRQIGVLSGHATPVSHVQFSPDGRRILTASPGDVVRLWDARGAAVAAIRAAPGETDGPLSVSFSPDGRQLLTAGPGPARVWDRDGRPILDSGADIGRVNGAAFSPDGQQIVMAGERGALLTDLRGQPVVSLAETPQPVTGASFSPDGQHLLTLLQDNTTQVWNLRGTQVGTALGPAQFSPDGQTLLTIGEDGTARLRDLTGRSLAAFFVKDAAVTDATFSPDSSRIMTVAANGPVRLWDEGGQSLAQFKESSSWGCVMARAAFSPDGTRAVTVGVYRIVQLWDLERMHSIDLQVRSRTWYWLTVINPTLFFGVIGLWITAVKMRAPLKPRFQNQRTLFGMWPAWAAAHGLIFLLALMPLWPLQALAGLALGHLLGKIVCGYLPLAAEQRWLALSGLGWLAGWATGEGLRLLLFPHGVYVDTRLVVLPLAGAGMAVGQWIALRRSLPGAHWLAVATAAGWAISAAMTGAEYTSGRVELALVQGIVAGGVSGAALVWLLMAPETEE
jgi:WD40 repeat protein